MEGEGHRCNSVNVSGIMGAFKRLLEHFFKRPIKNWNVENRAFKLIEEQERTKPSVAPRHPTTVEKLDNLIKEHPELLDVQRQKDESLHNMLKGMVVNPEKVTEIISKSSGQLPVDRSPVTEDDFGYLEPQKIPEGKCTIRQSMKFIADHHADPDNVTVQHIAKEYKLDTGQLKHILKYFQTLDLHIPDPKMKLQKPKSSPKSGQKQIGAEGETLKMTR